MPFILTNPWGLLALLAIPVVLAIHFLQRRAQVVVVSTLFLLPPPKYQAERGFRLERLLGSLPLWMQLLLVLLLSLLLSQPRFVDQKATLRIAIVLDGSASMSVFRQEVVETLKEELPVIQGTVPNVELWLLDSDLARERIYHGNTFPDLYASLENWPPNSGAISPEAALRVGRSLTGETGALLYLTDTELKAVPYGAQAYSVGYAVPNVGFTGVSYEPNGEGYSWEASVKNYSDQSVTRLWRVRYSNNTVSGFLELSLAPNELQVIRGILPSEVERAEVSLEEDAFAFDDTLPLLAPVPKELWLSSADSTSFSSKLLSSFDHLVVTPSGEDPDLVIYRKGASDEIPKASSGIVLLGEGIEPTPPLHSYRILSTDRALVSELNWQALLVPKQDRWTPSKDDAVLLWGGEEALLYSRQFQTEGGLQHQLVVNFTLENSNALQQEAFVILLHRFFDLLRSGKETPVYGNTELNQSLSEYQFTSDFQYEEIDVGGQILSATTFPAYTLPQASSQVGFFRLMQDGELKLEAANLFADTREANLQNCSTTLFPSDLTPQAEEVKGENSLFWRILLLSGLIALLVSWFVRHPSRS